MNELAIDTEQSLPVIELFKGSGQEKKAVFFINGFMASVYAGFKNHEFSSGLDIYIVHYERSETIYCLADELESFIAENLSVYDEIKIIGFSCGCIVLQRLQAIWGANKYKEKLITIAISPISISYFDVLSGFTYETVEKVSEDMAMRIFSKMKWWGDFEKLPFEVVRRQMLFVLRDNCFKGLLGCFDVAIFPRGDRICFSLGDVPDLADSWFYVQGVHDLRTIPLALIFNGLDELEVSALGGV